MRHSLKNRLHDFSSTITIRSSQNGSPSRSRTLESNLGERPFTRRDLIGLYSPWQNGIAERWVGSARREMLDHVIVLNERHLHRLLREYVDYYNEDRVHTQLRDSPMGRPRSVPKVGRAKTVAFPGPCGPLRLSFSARFPRSIGSKMESMNALPLQFLMLIFAGWVNRH